MIALKALVVDDSRVMRNMMMQSLRHTRLAEFEFIEAVDGPDAMEKFDPVEIDIAFVDWNMPQMTGLEFVRQVRSLGTNRHIPMVMITSEKSSSRIEESLRNTGANGYICKHHSVDELQEQLQKLIDQIESMKGSQVRGGSWLAKLFA